ncbi:MAG: DUF2163 domain-containing protein [Alphaproteobacteria bacterium]|nr:MAG: DUF2163 domain-containing protein [Alphaproteobacteria bacterium]
MSAAADGKAPADAATRLARAWILRRGDGLELGFTDHDRPVVVAGVSCAPTSGFDAHALENRLGLAVDNSAVAGVIDSDVITEADIAAGLWDGAEVRLWLVPWEAPEQATLIWRGRLGELRRRGAAFEAELRGLSEPLNRPQGQVYSRLCRAVLGDAACGVDLTDSTYRAQAVVEEVIEGGILHLSDTGGQPEGWFAHGQCRIGARHALIRADRPRAGGRRIELWEPLAVAPGDAVELVAGCDRRFETCRDKFANRLNFRGCPHLPGDGWLLADPLATGAVR